MWSFFNPPSPPARVTHVECMPRPWPWPSPFEEIARETRPHPRHQDPGDRFAPKPAAREHNPRLSAPVGQVVVLIPDGAKLELRYRYRDGTWSA